MTKGIPDGDIESPKICKKRTNITSNSIPNLSSKIREIINWWDDQVDNFLLQSKLKIAKKLPEEVSVLDEDTPEEDYFEFLKNGLKKPNLRYTKLKSIYNNEDGISINIMDTTYNFLKNTHNIPIFNALLILHRAIVQDLWILNTKDAIIKFLEKIRYNPAFEVDKDYYINSNSEEFDSEKGKMNQLLMSFSCDWDVWFGECVNKRYNLVRIRFPWWGGWNYPYLFCALRLLFRAIELQNAINCIHVK